MPWSLVFRIAASIMLLALARVDGVAQTPTASASIVTDTLRMMAGHTDYSRYTNAGACDRAIAQVWFSNRRRYLSDTLGSGTPATNVLPDTVVATAKMCAARFPANSANILDLWNLLRTFSVLGDEVAITRTIDRLITSENTPAGRARVLLRAIEILMPGILDGLPVKVGLVQTLLARLDAIGSAVKIQQFEARVATMRYWHAMWNTDSLRAHAQAAIDMMQTMTQDERDAVEGFRPYAELFLIANEAGDLAQQQTLLDRTLTDVGTWREGQGVLWTTPMSSLIETRKALYGEKTQSLSGTYWFNHGGNPRPMEGRLSLIMHVDHTCGVICFPQYALLKQLSQTYGAELDITLITDTRGFSPGTGPLSPTEEAAKAAHYFHTYLKLPGALLVDETPYTRRPDGRLMYQLSPIGEMFNSWRQVNALLIDREGRIRWIGSLGSGEDRRMIDAAIRRSE